MVEPMSVAIATAATTAATKTFGDLSSTLTKNIVAKSSGPLRSIYETITTNFTPHLHATYIRCTKVKTLLNQEEPADLLSIYVGSDFRCANKSFSDFEVIEECRSRKRAVVSGLGGTGKTIFMKYLWISLFENPQGKIPVFIELRKLNEVTKEDLLTYIYRTIVNTNSNVSPDSFKKTLRAGSFAFLLDGFDEVDDDKRAIISQQILDLANDNPECTIVLSSRPDSVFASWQSFSVFNVCPLTKQQVVSLIEKVTFDDDVKRKFIARINKDLYERHRSFLSMPLLAIMMLISFKTFADIPQKVHLFYDQAFEALFLRHDATKELFQRKIFCGLTNDVFRRYFSLFALLTYHDQKIDFSQDELESYLKKALKVENAKVDIGLFIRDLTESICLLQKDGTHYLFTHRSFQEYFVAYCVDRVVQKHASKLLPKLAVRASDNVLPMLFDMNEDLVESEFVIPFLSSLEGEIRRWPSALLLESYLERVGWEFTLKNHSDGGGEWSSDGKLELHKQFLSIRKLYPASFRLRKREEVDNHEFNSIVGFFNSRKVLYEFTVEVKRDKKGEPALVVSDKVGSVPDLHELRWVRDLRISVEGMENVAIIPALKKKVSAKRRAKNSSLEELLV